MRHYAARADDNQPEIIRALREIGCSVQPLSAVGRGVPDLLVGFGGTNYLLEIKNREGNSPAQQKLTDRQVEWHGGWRGSVRVVYSPQEAVQAVTEK